MHKSYRLVWYDNELLLALNKLGYVHFITGEQADGFINGRAFFFREVEKIYGYVDTISVEDSARCEENKEFIINKANPIVEGE